MTKFIRCVYLIIVIFCVLTIISVECSSNLVEEDRKRKRPFFMKPFAAYTYLANLVAIKIKVAVIAFTVLAIGALFLKGFIGYGFGKLWWPSGCGSCSNVYSSGPPEIISDHSPYHQHYEHDLDHSGSMVYYDRVKYPPGKTSGVKSADISSYYKNVAPPRQTREVRIKRRSIESHKPISQLEEICKRRYVCESDVRARHNIVAAYQLYFFGREGLAKYRDRTKTAPRTREQCAALYKQCTDPMNILYGRRKKRNIRRKWYSTIN